MKLSRLFKLIVIFYLGTNYSNAQCEEEEKIRTLLIGDSWAFFMAVDGTLDDVFMRWGHSDLKFFTNAELSENGAKTTDFLESDKQAAMIQAFQDYPDADHVHLSIGGNDFLRAWKMSYTEEETEALKQDVVDKLIQVVDFIRDNKPGVKIMWSSYVYTNFEEEISRFFLPEEHPFYSTWEKMEFPDNESINIQSINFMEAVAAAFENYDDVYCFNAPGLMQYHYGQTSPLQVAPFGTYQPESAPLPNGFIDYPSPRNSMRDYGVTKDCFHLSALGYRRLVSYQTQKYYHKAFMNDAYFLPENDNKSGSISSNDMVSSDLNVGKLNGEEFVTILHFNTANNLDSTVNKARLFLKRKEQIGENPISEDLTVAIKLEGFGETSELEGDDFYATAEVSAVPCRFGRNSGEDWVRLDLPDALVAYLNLNQSVQLKLKYKGNEEAFISFNGTANPEFAPVLDIIYGEAPQLNVNENNSNIETFHLYPNPTQNQLNIVSQNNPVQQLQIYNLTGNLVHQENTNSNKVQLTTTHLNPGVYFLKIQTTAAQTTLKFIKK
jgi:hypothetical protein